MREGADAAGGVKEGADAAGDAAAGAAAAGSMRAFDDTRLLGSPRTLSLLHRDRNVVRRGTLDLGGREPLTVSANARRGDRSTSAAASASCSRGPGRGGRVASEGRFDHRVLLL